MPKPICQPEFSTVLCRYSVLTPFCLFNHTIRSEIFNTVDWAFIVDLPHLTCLNEYGLITETIEATQKLWSIYIVACNCF